MTIALEDLAGALLSAAKAAGADAADTLVSRSESLSVAAREGALEHVERAETIDFGLRVIVDGPGGRRQASVSASDPRPETLRLLAQNAVAMARAAPPDPDALFAPAELRARSVVDLALLDPAPPPAPEALLAQALALEAAARAVAGVTQAEGAEAGWRMGAVFLATSDGFALGYPSGSHGLSVAAIAGSGLGMERDYAYSSARHAADLRAIEAIGREAGERAAARLGPRKPPGGAFPVLMEPRVASGFLGGLLGAIDGRSVVRGATFLKDKRGERILPAGVDVIDDPLSPRGPGSRPFDGEGVSGSPKRLIADGVLAEWLLDAATAARLGLVTNGCASRGVAGAPSPSSSNARLTPGPKSPETLRREIGRGLLVTEMMGRGLNAVTGDYSRGASGFWIEDGEIAYPVNELTVAGHMLELLAGLEAGSDLGHERRIEAPTLRLEGLTIGAG